LLPTAPDPGAVPPATAAAAAAAGCAIPPFARRGSKIEWSDWNIFSRHSFYLLLGGYFGVADQQVNTICECSNGRLGLWLLPTL